MELLGFLIIGLVIAILVLPFVALVAATSLAAPALADEGAKVTVDSGQLQAASADGVPTRAPKRAEPSDDVAHAAG